MIKGFKKDEFMAWLKEKFPKVLEAHWNYELVENVIDYATAHEHIAKDQFAEFVSDMLPEVEFLEVARFLDDGCLTDETIKALGMKQV